MIRSRVLRGTAGEELSWLAEPQGTPIAQATATYEALVTAWEKARISGAQLRREVLFLRDIENDLPGILEARERVLSAHGFSGAPRPAFIGHAPADDHVAFYVTASAIRSVGEEPLPRDVPVSPAASCDELTQSTVRVYKAGDRVELHTNNLYGAGPDAASQVAALFRNAEALLARHGLDFHDVVRTWLHLRDIERDYDALNEARRDFFERCGLRQRPASTGVEGAPLPADRCCSMSLVALRSPGVERATMSTPTLNEAWSYGADFSRGLRVDDERATALLVSGTASIDEAGNTVHVGDLDGQAERMLDNIETLLQGQNASFRDVLSGTLYLRHAADVDAVRKHLTDRGFRDFPCASVKATLCRPDLLCEAEVYAILPRRDS